MKGYVYYNSLTREVKSLFKKRHEEDQLTPRPFEEYLDIEFDDMLGFISGSFIWIGTPEGHDYWEYIAKSDWRINCLIGKPLIKHTF